MSDRAYWETMIRLFAGVGLVACSTTGSGDKPSQPTPTVQPAPESALLSHPMFPSHRLATSNALDASSSYYSPYYVVQNPELSRQRFAVQALPGRLYFGWQHLAAPEVVTAGELFTVTTQTLGSCVRVGATEVSEVKNTVVITPLVYDTISGACTADLRTDTRVVSLTIQYVGRTIVRLVGRGEREDILYVEQVVQVRR